MHIEHIYQFQPNRRPAPPVFSLLKLMYMFEHLNITMESSDVWKDIAQHLPLQDLSSLSQVSKACSEACLPILDELHVRALPYLQSYNWHTPAFELMHTCEKGDRRLIDFFVSRGGCDLCWGMYGAARSGRRDLVDRFIQMGVRDWNGGMAYAAHGGHLDLVKFFISMGADDWDDGLNGALAGEHQVLANFFIHLGASE